MSGAIPPWDVSRTEHGGFEFLMGFELREPKVNKSVPHQFCEMSVGLKILLGDSMSHLGMSSFIFLIL